MKAIIVAGGRGERLKPLTDTIPKAMVKVGNKPILEHIVNLLKKHKISEFIFSLCYLPDKIISYFGDGSKFGVKTDYIFEEKNNPLGTAGAILGAEKFINNTFIVVYGDIIRELDIRKMISNHKKSRSIATIAVYKNYASNPKSIIGFDINHRVQRFIERPKAKDKRQKIIWSNASFYVFEPEIFEFIPQNKKSDFGADIFPNLLKKGEKISAFVSKGYFVDIGDPGKLSHARKTFKSS